jgi:branched-chain amino acid transport system permease protein
MIQMLAQTLVNGINVGALYGLTAVGLSLTFGVMKILNVGHGEFLMVGGYLAFWLLRLFGVDPFLGLPLVAIALFLLGIISYKLFFATLSSFPEEIKVKNSLLVGFGLFLVFPHIARLLWTGDERAITPFYSGDSFPILGVRFGYVPLAGLAVTVAAVYWISRSRLGLGLMSIREDEDAAEAAGVNTLRYKLTAFLISTFFAGMTGGVYAYFAAATLPGAMFSAEWTFDAVIIVFVGGVGTIVGPIIGSVFFVLLQQLLSLYLTGGSHVLVFGILFIIVVLYLPGGLIGLVARLRQSSPQKESRQIAA